MLRLSLLLAASLITCGCSTGYQKQGMFRGGYSEMKLAQDAYLVEYRSNAFTSQSKNLKHALHRAAELANEHGYQYFVITEQNDISKEYNAPVVATTENLANKGGQRVQTTITGGKSKIKPGIALFIKMSNERIDNSYEALAVLGNFKKE